MRSNNPKKRGEWEEAGEVGGVEGGGLGEAKVNQEKREKPSRKIITDFILIDTDNPAIGYAI